MCEKTVTFAVPCYNSAAYMDHCVETLLAGGDDIEIILIDDGSQKDDTPAICDRYAARYPDIIRVIHQENGGHGEGVNQGLRNARGFYYKVVDSDDWLDEAALGRVMAQLRRFAGGDCAAADMVVCNFVYEYVADNTQHVVRYTHVFPVGQLFTWADMGHFKPSQFLLMHSVIYRTELLRTCGLELPKHTFYVDNIFVYQPLPFVKSIYYLNENLYRYFIGRADQSVNENVMVKRVDQQLLVTRIMMHCHDLHQLRTTNRRLAGYMTSYLSIMMAISSVLLDLDGSGESMRKRDDIWEELRQTDDRLFHRIKYTKVSGLMILPGDRGRRASIKMYRVARYLYKFN